MSISCVSLFHNHETRVPNVKRNRAPWPHDWILRIQERSSRLTSSEKKIAQVLLQNQGLVETHTATELAARAGVSKATTARFSAVWVMPISRRFGFRPVKSATGASPIQTSDRYPSPQPLGGQFPIISNWNCSNLTRTFEELRSDLLPEIAQILETAPRIWFVGFGDEQGVARLGQSLFARLRHGVQELRGEGQTWANELSMTGSRDVLIVLTFEPRPKVLRSLLAHARTTRMRVITLTDHSAMRRRQNGFRKWSCLAMSRATARFHARHNAVGFAVGSRLHYLGRNPEAVGQRISTLAAIDEELDQFE